MTQVTCGRIFLFGHWMASLPREIKSPFRRDLDAFRFTLEIITHSVANWLPRMTLKQRSV